MKLTRTDSFFDVNGIKAAQANLNTKSSLLIPFNTNPTVVNALALKETINAIAAVLQLCLTFLAPEAVAIKAGVDAGKSSIGLAASEWTATLQDPTDESAKDTRELAR